MKNGALFGYNLGREYTWLEEHSLYGRKLFFITVENQNKAKPRKQILYIANYWQETFGRNIHTLTI